ncbi:glycosyltransferase [Hymenobacter sp. BT491]|uniref:glycosyltransferase n=1 Tax=Hymenobacter sp. BT491 TaxID=2766779 RepID=UPI001653DB32|nr:glycosyltransferase [Hymenobacter sp. BT491]MBC6988803.1 glycosyltransferase [Hymenobacter sp. BT491]
MHVLHALRFSGAEVMLRLAAPTVNAQGYEQHMLADGSEVGDYADTLAAAGFRVHHRPFKNYSIGHLWQLYRFLRQQKFTVVHNHTEQNFFWYLLVARLAGVPHLVSTVHNAFAFKGQVRMRRGLYRWIARQLGARFTAIGPSVAQVEEITYHNPTTLVPNWLDESYFVPARNAEERTAARRHYQVPDGTVVLISVGGCSAIKNHGAILEALAALRPKVSSPLLYLHVGEGQTHLAEQKQAQELGLSDIVRFVGQLHDVRTALLASDIYVMPSMFEGLSISLLEALSCGMAAAVYDNYGLRDLVQDGQTGRCVPPNPQALTEALYELIESPELRIKYGAAARQFIQKHYSMRDSLSKLLRLYGTADPKLQEEAQPSAPPTAPIASS